MKVHLLRVVTMLGCGSLAAAQETTGDIRGRVRSPASGAIAGARISATGPDLLGTRNTLTASDGVFQLLALPPGTYTLRVSAIGFNPVITQVVRVQLGRTVGLDDIELQPSTVQLSEVRIVAPRVTLDPTRTTVGATIEVDELASLPADRDYKSVIAILPHLNTSYHGDPVNAGGSTGLENMYFIDGANVTAPWQAGTATSLPYNFVRSVEVRTGGYEAQYGRALGAIVNAITHTGTNDFETSFFSFFTHGSLAARPRAEPALRETRSYSYDVGARVSGPFVRDKLWFSAAYNPRFDHATRVVASLGSFSDDRRADVFAGKLTWQVLPTASAEFSVFGDPTTRHAVTADVYSPGLTPLNADPYLRLIETGGVVASLKGTMMFGSSALFETSLSRSSGRDRSGGDTELGRTGMWYVDFLSQTIEGASPYPIYVSQARTTAVTRATITAGRNTVIAGAEYEVGRVARSSGNLGLLRTDSSQFLVDSQWVKGKFRSLLPAAYLQNSWRVTNGLTVNAGLRWSRQLHRFGSGENTQRFGDEWQPRLGFNWQLGQARTHRLFGSYGRYYQQVPLNLASIFFADSRAKQEYYSADPRLEAMAPYRVDDFSLRESYFAGKGDGMSAEHFDELTGGYEQLLAGGARVTVRAMRRTLRSAFLIANDPTREPYTFVGTPGEGDLSFLPRARREYTALETAIDGDLHQFRYRVSYVLSRTWGNFTGLYASDGYFANPGTSYTLAVREHAINSTGLLPNDRTHVLKLSSTYSGFGTMVAGAFATFQSGTPLNDFGVGTYLYPTFLSRRGSEGRSPAIWDLNLRLAYDVPRKSAPKSKLILDILHAGNPRTAVRIDQQHYYGVDVSGNPITPNPGYLQPVLFQPPMSARLGMDITF